MSVLTRRRFGGLALGIGLGTQVSCASTSDNGRLRASFYGDPDVNKGIGEALDHLQRTMGIRIGQEAGGFESYYDKLATRFAGGAAPDIVMNDFTHLSGYARRGALLDLTDFVPDPIDPKAGRTGVLDGGRDGERLYGVSIGTHSQGMVANEKLFEQYRVPVPENGMTWDRWIQHCEELGRASGHEVYGSADGGGRDFALDIWLRQRGADLFDEQGGLGFEQDQLYEWFDLWARLRRREAVAPINVTADTTVEPITTSQVAMDFKFSNIAGLQPQVDGSLRMLPIPAASEGDHPAQHQYIKPTNVFSVNADTPSPERAVRIAAAFLTDPEVGNRVGVTLGSPPNAETFRTLSEKQSGAQKRGMDFDEMVERNATGTYPPTRPMGADQLLTATGALLGQLNLSVGYGQLTPKQAAEDFFHRSRSFLLEAR